MFKDFHLHIAVTSSITFYATGIYRFFFIVADTTFWTDVVECTVCFKPSNLMHICRVLKVNSNTESCIVICVIHLSVTWFSEDDQHFQALVRANRKYSYLNRNFSETNAHPSPFTFYLFIIPNVFLVVVLSESENEVLEGRFMSWRVSSLKR